MGNINLCIAMSLDGFIADKAGKVDFLFEKPRIEPDEDYKRFYAGVDIIIYGSVTYKQLTREISPGKEAYPGKKSYVFTQHPGEFAADTAAGPVEFTGLSPRGFAETVCRDLTGEAWLFGGRALIHSFMEADLIDKYWIYVVPVILGEGVPLFTPAARRLNLTLTSVSKTDAMVKLFYDRDRGAS
ncbi:dihydrofolate reductase [Spirochaetia bacterium]|nr:dihydrofolate reductase [Spirochaetia bacterium]